jgi:hypothetical protein
MNTFKVPGFRTMLTSCSRKFLFLEAGELEEREEEDEAAETGEDDGGLCHADPPQILSTK